MEAADIVTRIPVPSEFKQAIYATMSHTRWNYSPWSWYVTVKMAVKTRARIIAAFYPYLHKGARSAALVMCLFTHAHRQDPLLSKVWHLIMMISKTGWQTFQLVAMAYDLALPPTTPMAALAAYFKMLGIAFGDGICSLGPHSIPLARPTTRPTISKWMHDWRAFLKFALLRTHAAHRRQFQQLEAHFVDYDKSLALYKALLPGQERASLQIMLAGGVITADRDHRWTGADATCKLCHMERDDEEHRYWTCPAVECQRKELASLPTLSRMTRTTGLVSNEDELTVAETIRLQRYMLNVTRQHILAHKQANEEEMEKDLFQDDDDVADPDQRPPDSESPCDTTQGAGGGVGHITTFAHGARPRPRVELNSMLKKAVQPRKACTLPKRVQARLPQHIVLGFREYAGSSIPRQPILRCGGCGALARLTNVGRFLRVHGKCADGNQLRNGRKRQLTQEARRVLSAESGHDLQHAQKRARWAFASALLTVQA